MLDPFVQVIGAIFNIAYFVIIAQVILSWLITFDILNLQNDAVRKIWDVLTRLTEPVYSKIRQVIPTFNGIDLSPLIALLGLSLLSGLLGV